MECFRIDESGYTGFDLLNPQQRLQGAAAIAISDEDATRLINEHFPRRQALELKYRALSRRPSSRPLCWRCCAICCRATNALPTSWTSATC